MAVLLQSFICWPGSHCLETYSAFKLWVKAKKYSIFAIQYHWFFTVDGDDRVAVHRESLHLFLHLLPFIRLLVLKNAHVPYACFFDFWVAWTQTTLDVIAFVIFIHLPARWFYIRCIDWTLYASRSVCLCQNRRKLNSCKYAPLLQYEL